MWSYHYSKKITGRKICWFTVGDILRAHRRDQGPLKIKNDLVLPLAVYLNILICTTTLLTLNG
jgi:hypothetical protein